MTAQVVKHISTVLGQKRGENSETNQHIGMSRGGKNTKVHAVVDGLGNRVCVQLSDGNLHDVSVAEDVLSNVPVEGSIVMGDKAYGSKALREYIEENGGMILYCTKI